MKIIELNLLQGAKAKEHISLAKEIASEFPELQEMFNDVAIVVSCKQHHQDGSVDQAVKSYFDPSKNFDIIHSPKLKPAYCIIREKQAVIVIVADIINELPDWKQAFVIRHEFCHLLHRSKPSPALSDLKTKYSKEWLFFLREYREEYVVHICMIKRYLNDWIRADEIGFRDVESPRDCYRRIKKTKGKTSAIAVGIDNAVHLLQVVYVLEYLLETLKGPNVKRTIFEHKLEKHKKWLISWWYFIQKDVDSDLSPPREWLTREHFEDKEAFFSQISELLEAINI